MGYQARRLQIGRAGAIARTCETRFDGHGRNTNARPDHDRQPIGCKVRKISSTPGRLVLVPMLLARACHRLFEAFDWLDQQMESRTKVRGWQKFLRGEQSRIASNANPPSRVLRCDRSAAGSERAGEAAILVRASGGRAVRKSPVICIRRSNAQSTNLHWAALHLHLGILSQCEK